MGAHLEAAPGSRPRVELATEKLDTLAHSDEAMSGTIPRTKFIERPTVIDDFDDVRKLAAPFWLTYRSRGEGGSFMRAIAAIVLVGMVVAVFADYRAQQKALNRLESRDGQAEP